MPQISVIVPVYKVEPYLRRCVDSILNQTFTDFELILVDDGSPDGCPAICDEYAQKDTRVHVIHQKNGGLSAARNTGIDWAFEHSDSEWLSFIDSDDWVHPEMLERLYQAVIQNHVNISVCSYIETYGQTPKISENCQTEVSIPETFYIEHTVLATIACAKLYRKSCFETIRYPVGRIHEDEFTTYKLLFAENEIAYAQVPLYFYYVNCNGITKSHWSENRLHAIDAKKEQLEFFHNHQFHSAYKRAARALVWLLADNIKQISISKDSKLMTTSRKLRKELRLYLNEYKNLLQISVKHDRALYEAAYPQSMKLLEILSAVKRKLSGS